jgi:brefeldin A-inhibited guanine nucleotide-exchange protein 3
MTYSENVVLMFVTFVSQAACHKERAVSKKAVAYIHDTVTAVLNEQAELPHFHFNEALFKPFENLLCLELCDVDVQDQVSSVWRQILVHKRPQNSDH